MAIRNQIISASRISAAGVCEAGKAPGRLQRYVSGFTATLMSTLVSQACTYLSMVFMARMLGLDVFGRLGIVQATLTAIFGASTLGIGITSTRFVARYRVADPARTGRMMGLCSLASLCSGILFSVVLFLFANVIATRFLRAESLTAAIRITAPYCVLMTMNAHQIGALLGFEAYTRLLRAQARQSVTALLLAGLLTATLGFNGAVLSLPFGAAFAWFYTHLELAAECRHQRVQPTFHDVWKEREILMGFTFPASLSALIGNVAIWGAQGLLARAQGGMLEMGLWTAAATFRSIVLLAPGVLNRVSGPILSSLHDHDTGEAYRRTLWSAAVVATGAATAVGLLIWLMGPLLLTIFGSGYRRALPLLPLVLGSAVIEVYACSAYQAMLAHARMKYQLAVIAVWGATLIVVALIAIPQHLARGLALSYFASWSMAAVMYTLIVRKLLVSRGGGLLRERPAPDSRVARLCGIDCMGQGIGQSSTQSTLP